MTRQVRSFLFLQGVCSPFYRRLAEALGRRGHRVTKIHFNVGDGLYWSRQAGKAYAFRRPLDELPGFIEALYHRHDITDQLVFGDCRPVHRPARRLAQAHGIRTHAFEEGYFRPHWVTLEREGVNGHSLLPRDPAWFLETGRTLPEPRNPKRFQSPFKVRARHDVCYHLAGLGNPLLYPRYRNHAPITAPLEYAGYLKRFTQLRRWKPQDKARIRGLIAGRRPYFVLPLQLNTDAQIRDHSSFTNMQEVIDRVMRSFAQHAAGDALLCIKNHPLDMGLVNFSRLIRKLERHYGIEGRTVYLESGDLNPLLQHAVGTVTVNSTVGIVSLEHARPTLALSDPIYQMAGLTFQGELDEFWHQPAPPNTHLFHCFRDTVIHATQINGGFYCEPGIELAVANAMGILEAEHSPLERLL